MTRLRETAPETLFRILRAITALALLALPAMLIYDSIFSTHNKAQSDQHAAANTSIPPIKKEFPVTPPEASPLKFTKPEQPLPENGEVVLHTDAEPIAPLKVKSQTGTHYLLKLCDVATGASVMTVFVRGGSTIEAKVPLGDYKVKYASGTSWYGYEWLFGPSTSYQQAKEAFHFKVEPDVAPDTVKLAEIVRDIDANILARMKGMGLSDKNIALMLEGTDKDGGRSGLDRFDADWWNRNILSKIKEASTHNELADLLNRRFDLAAQIEAAEVLIGYTITLYPVRGGTMKTETIRAEDF